MTSGSKSHHAVVLARKAYEQFDVIKKILQNKAMPGIEKGM
jgi:RecA-family ATPase